MPKNKFYIVRHAESENNLLELESSKIENKDQFGLTEKGRSHTESEASAFKCFDFVYTSPFRRAVETAQIFAMTSGKEVIVDNSLREVDVGDYELHPYHEVESYLQEHGEGLPYPNGESMAAARDRAINFLKQVDQKHVDDHILIVTHGDIVLFLIEHLDANFDRKKAIEHYNHDSSRKVVGPIVSEPENGPGVA